MPHTAIYMGTKMAPVFMSNLPQITLTKKSVQGMHNHLGRVLNTCSNWPEHSGYGGHQGSKAQGNHDGTVEGSLKGEQSWTSPPRGSATWPWVSYLPQVLLFSLVKWRVDWTTSRTQTTSHPYEAGGVKTILEESVKILPLPLHF